MTFRKIRRTNRGMYRRSIKMLHLVEKRKAGCGGIES